MDSTFFCSEAEHCRMGRGIPGGRIDPLEDLQSAIRREVSEETSLQLTGTPELVAAQDIFIPEIELHVVRLTYMADTHSNLSAGLVGYLNSFCSWSFGA